jgi:CDP-paratose 2-epimerase
VRWIASLVVAANLFGAYHTLELARRERARLVFLSTSRVYPLAALNAVAYREDETRFALSAEQELPGVSPAGVSEAFSLEGARTLYGATKLAAELLAAEYADAFCVPAVVNRCGVVAGPWQMGKEEQGVFAHWLLSHYFGRELRYIGYGGRGKQVRDVLHVDDLVDLVEEQLLRPERWAGVTVNVGGGPDRSLSLLEATEICRELTGNRVDVSSVEETRPGDIPIYVSDCARLHSLTEWRPRRSPHAILEDMLRWVRENERALRTALR